MLKKINKKRIIMMVMLILSLASLYILAIPSLAIKRGLTADVNNNGFLTAIVRTIGVKDIYVTVIIISSLILLQMILSIIFLKKYDDFRFFGYAGFIGGGLGLHLIYLIFVFLIKKYKSPREIIFKWGHAVRLSSTAFVGLTIIAAPILIICSKSVDEFYHLDRIIFSSDKKAINVIEIYTDAIDRDFSENYLTKNKDLKDFTLYNNFLNSGQFTHMSKPLLDEGFINNPFHITNNKGLTTQASYKKYIYSKEFAMDIVGPDSDLFKSGASYDPDRKSIEGFSDALDRKYVGNYINVTSSDSYAISTSGSQAVSRKLNKDAWGMNYLTAKRLETNGWGVTNLSPEVLVQKQIFKNAIVDPHKDKGGHLYLHDLLVHGPFYNNEQGHLDMDINSIDQSYKGYSNYLSRIISTLKEKNIYDNSLIFVYGDHGNHGLPFWDTKTIRTTKYSNKPLSALFVKFPYEARNNIRVNKSNTIYGPWLKQALNQYVESYHQNNGNPFPVYNGDSENKVSEKVLDIDNHFKLSEKRNYPLFITNHTATFVHFTKDASGRWMLTHTNSDQIDYSNDPDKPTYTKYGKTCFSNTFETNKYLLQNYMFDSYKGGA